jgi:hypothetical protein
MRRTPWGIAPEILARDEDLAGVRFEQTGRHRDSGRFAGAFWAEQPVDFAFADFEADLINSADLAESFEELVDFKQRHGRGRARGCCYTTRPNSSISKQPPPR